eukprot:scaffold176_cov356-Prasinococcus_capsulatus_cf.AAC.5
MTCGSIRKFCPRPGFGLTRSALSHCFSERSPPSSGGGASFRGRPRRSGLREAADRVEPQAGRSARRHPCRTCSERRRRGQSSDERSCRRPGAGARTWRHSHHGSARRLAGGGP